MKLIKSAILADTNASVKLKCWPDISDRLIYCFISKHIKEDRGQAMGE